MDTVAVAGQQALWASLVVGGPVLLLILVVGLIISLLQALTQVQEAALAFVPKLLALGLALLFGSSAALTALRSLTEGLFDQVVAVGGLR